MKNIGALAIYCYGDLVDVITLASDTEQNLELKDLETMKTYNYNIKNVNMTNYFLEKVKTKKDGTQRNVEEINEAMKKVEVGHFGDGEFNFSIKDSNYHFNLISLELKISHSIDIKKFKGISQKDNQFIQVEPLIINNSNVKQLFASTVEKEREKKANNFTKNM